MKLTDILKQVIREEEDFDLSDNPLAPNKLLFEPIGEKQFEKYIDQIVNGMVKNERRKEIIGQVKGDRSEYFYRIPFTKMYLESMGADPKFYTKWWEVIRKRDDFQYGMNMYLVYNSLYNKDEEDDDSGSTLIAFRIYDENGMNPDYFDDLVQHTEWYLEKRKDEIRRAYEQVIEKAEK
jgi:hypothetical protein